MERFRIGRYPFNFQGDLLRDVVVKLNYNFSLIEDLLRQGGVSIDPDNLITINNIEKLIQVINDKISDELNYLVYVYYDGIYHFLSDIEFSDNKVNLIFEGSIIKDGKIVSSTYIITCDLDSEGNILNVTSENSKREYNISGFRVIRIRTKPLEFIDEEDLKLVGEALKDPSNSNSVELSIQDNSSTTNLIPHQSILSTIVSDNEIAHELKFITVENLITVKFTYNSNTEELIGSPSLTESLAPSSETLVLSEINDIPSGGRISDENYDRLVLAIENNADIYTTDNTGLIKSVILILDTDNEIILTVKDNNLTEKNIIISKFNNLIKTEKVELATKESVDNKVDKELGKGLSSNDYTSEEKTLVGTIINKVDKVQGKGLSTYDLTESRKNKLDSYPELTGAGNKALMDNGTFVEITGEGIIFSDIEIINIEDLQVEYVTEEIYNKIANAIINNRHIVLNSINRSDISPFSLRAAEPINVITYSVIRQEYLNFTNKDIFLVITDGTTTTEITIESTFHVTIIKRPSSISLDNSNPLPTVELTQTSIGLQANLVLAKSDSGVQLVKTEDGLVAQFKWDGENQEIKLKYVTSQEYSSLNGIDQGTLYFITDNRYIMFQGIKYGDNISREEINDIKELLNQKVDKEEGKGLSSNDYSDSDKSKVDKIITNGEGNKYLSDNGKYLEIPESPIWVITLKSDDMEAELLSLFDEIVEKAASGYVIYLSILGTTFPCTTLFMSETKIALELYTASGISKGIFINSFVIDKGNNKVTTDDSSLLFTGTFTLDSLGDGTKFLSDDGKYKEISIDKEIETIYITFTFSTSGGAYFAKCPSDTYSKVANAVNNKKGIIINFEDPYSGINSYNLFAQSIQERTENGQIYYDLYTISQLPTSITKENGLQLLLKVITITPNSVVFIDDLEGLDRMLEADITLLNKGNGTKFLSDDGTYKEIESSTSPIIIDSEDDKVYTREEIHSIIEAYSKGTPIFILDGENVIQATEVVIQEGQGEQSSFIGLYISKILHEKKSGDIGLDTVLISYKYELSEGSSIQVSSEYTNLKGTGDGSKYLANDGTYKEIQVPSISPVIIDVNDTEKVYTSEEITEISQAHKSGRDIYLKFGSDPELRLVNAVASIGDSVILFASYMTSISPGTRSAILDLGIDNYMVQVTAGESIYFQDNSFILPKSGTGDRFLSDDGTYKKVVLTDYLPLSAGSENKLTGDLYFANGTKVSGSEENILSSDAQIEGAAFITSNNSGYIIKDSEGNNRTVLGLDSNNVLGVGVASNKTVLYSNSDLIHYTSGAEYKIWDENNLIDPATKSGNNTFTGTNSFESGKFSVGGFAVSSSDQLFVRFTAASDSIWEKGITWIRDNVTTSAIKIGACGNADIPSFAWIAIGSQEYNDAQYKFYSSSLRVPTAFSIQSGDSTLVSSNDTNMVFGDTTRTCYLRSNNSSLLHNKNNTNYVIWDASNLSDPVTKSGDNIFTGNNTFTAGKFNVGVFSINNLSSLTVDVGANAGAWSRYLRFMSGNATLGATYGAYSSSDGSINYAWIGVGDVGYDSAQYKFTSNRLATPSEWELLDKGTSKALILYNSEIQHFGRAIGVTYIRSGDDDLYHTKSSTNYKILDESNWQGVANSKSVVAFITANGYPTVGRLDGSDIGWLRTPTNGLLPTSPVSLANGGNSSLGNSSWSFSSASIANIYANNYFFGNTGMHLESTGDEMGLLNTGVAKKLKIGSLLVSANYANTTLVPTNGVYVSGRIRSDDSIMVGYNKNVTSGLLGYGLNYGNTFAAGMGSEYSSGALVLYKILNPNIEKAGYNVPYATTGTPTYLKIHAGALTLGVGETKAYTAGEEVTVTEYNVLTSKGGALSTGETLDFYAGSEGAGGGIGNCTKGGIWYWFPNDGGVVVGNSSATHVTLRTAADQKLYHQITTGTKYEIITEKGGTIGPLIISGMGSSPFVVNNYDTNGTDICQIFRVQGYNRFLVGWSETSGGPFIQRSSDNSCILIKSDGAYWGSSLGTSALKKLATQEWVLEQLEALKTS